LKNLKFGEVVHFLHLFYIRVPLFHVSSTYGNLQSLDFRAMVEYGAMGTWNFSLVCMPNRVMVMFTL